MRSPCRLQKIPPRSSVFFLSRLTPTTTTHARTHARTHIHTHPMSVAYLHVIPQQPSNQPLLNRPHDHHDQLDLGDMGMDPDPFGAEQFEQIPSDGSRLMGFFNDTRVVEAVRGAGPGPANLRW